MKLYHIADTKSFFNTLSKCDGAVSVITESGREISLTAKGHEENLKLVADTFKDAVIREIELSFSEPRDAARILTYCASMKNVA